jgi:hypothetical protein
MFILFAGNINLNMGICITGIVGKATELRGGRSGVRIPSGQIFLLLQNVQKGCGAHPTSGYRGSLAGIKRLGA